MIFGTVGTHSAPFDRLVRSLDAFASKTSETVLIQLGTATYIPRHARWFESVGSNKFAEFMRAARVVVSHGGDTVLEALHLGVPLIVVPRRRAFKEHIDDHQLHFALALERRGLSPWCEPNDLAALLSLGANQSPVISHAPRDRLTNALRDAIWLNPRRDGSGRP